MITTVNRSRVCIAIFTLSLLFTLATNSSTDNTDLQFVLQGIEYNSSLIGNCNVKASYTVEVTQYPEGTNASIKQESDLYFTPSLLEKVEKKRFEYDIILKGEKHRVEEKVYKYTSADKTDSRELVEQHALWAYDGIKTRKIFYPIKRFSGTIGTGQLFSLRGIYNLPLVLSEYLNINEALSSAYPDIKVVDKSSLKGIECYILEGTYKLGSTKIKLWLAPEFGFMPIRKESYGDKFEFIEETSYGKYKGTLPFIKHQITQVFLKKSESDKLIVEQREITVDEIEFACPPEEFPDSIFKLVFPAKLEEIIDRDKSEVVSLTSLEGEEILEEEITDTPLGEDK